MGVIGWVRPAERVSSNGGSGSGNGGSISIDGIGNDRERGPNTIEYGCGVYREMNFTEQQKREKKEREQGSKESRKVNKKVCKIRRVS